MVVSASANRELDEILDQLGAAIQLSDSQFQRAKSSYEAVGSWLDAEGSPVARFRPQIFPQGSLQLDTTVRPLAHTEFDLDLVCLLNFPGATPIQVYDLLLARMRSHGRYAPIVSTERRCIRLNYAGEFHLDIVPAIPDPHCPPGETYLLIPDRHKRVFCASNPKGYYRWFTSRTSVRRKSAVFNERQEPLRDPVPAYLKAPLRLAVQLLKRWRDVAFSDRMDLAPSSIILTTLAGTLYEGADHPTDALAGILSGICAWANRETIRLQNPSNPKESITNRWDERPASYQEFLTEVFAFNVHWQKLLQNRFPDCVAKLEELFGEALVKAAVARFAESRHDARRAGTLFADRITGGLMVSSAPGMMPGAFRVKDHNFHGQ